MRKFEEIVDKPWVQMTLFAESIPHLLHWDLAYLWILEKPQAVRPDKWKERIEAWKYLLAMLMMDRLRRTQVSIEEPLSDYTRRFGIDSLCWLELEGSGNPVGVLSPVVLVRPLPDYKRTNLDTWKQIAEDPFKLDAQSVNHLLKILASQLNQQHNSTFAGRLAKCILNEFNPVPTGNPPNTKSVQFSFLGRISWADQDEDARPRTIPLLLHGEGHGDYWLPKCLCGVPLTRAQQDPAIIVTSDIVSLNCSSCNNVTDVNLSDFLVWLPDREQDPQAILWKRDRLTSNPAKGFPPEPRVMASELEYRWQVGELGAQPDRQFLRLSFSNRTIVQKTLADLCYSKLLVPGNLSPTYLGIPIRADWIHAVTNIAHIKAEVDTNIPTITYRNVGIHGLPVPVDLVFGPVTISIDKNIAVGLYPDPARMPNDWNTFRAFVAGQGRDKYSMKSRRHKSILAWVAQSDEALPVSFSIESDNPTIGTTFHIPAREETVSNDESLVTEINVGIDFGTTNTLVYVAPPDSEPTSITAESFGIRPAQLQANVSWLTEASGNVQSAIDFLPAPTFGKSRIDHYLIPTAVWVSAQTALIRWHSTPPNKSFRADARFKSRQSSPLKLEYLRELVFLTIPEMVSKAADRYARIKLNLGFSFPLAFGYRDREEMRKTLQELTASLQQQGVEADCFSINESRACVRAFGVPRLNQHFLVADMGGGTLDVAFFTTTEDQENLLMHQIGSLRYAGEDFVESFAATEDDRWKVRDSIAGWESPNRYGRDARAQKILQRFVAFAFEYLRTMLLAFKEGRENESIKMVLVGNGWHLIDAFSSDQQRSPQQVFKEAYDHLTRQLGIDGVELYLDAPLPALPSSKHLVVIGALRNAWRGQATRELDSADSLMSRLPAGRGMSLGRMDKEHLRLHWYDLVGEGEPIKNLSESDLKADSAFFFSEMPGFSQSWKQNFLSLFGANSPDDLPHLAENQMREQIYDSIKGTPPKVGKGPLQVILEQSWKQRLTT